LTFYKKIDFLKSIGSDKVPHSSKTLLDHLIGTHDILQGWGKEQIVLDAGLFHSVYGTAKFMPNKGLVDNRQVIIDLIGDQAEEIVHWFCIIVFPRIPEMEKFKDPLKSHLLAVERANLLEQEDVKKNMMTWEEAYGL
jgi:hypothetical protein